MIAAQLTDYIRRQFPAYSHAGSSRKDDGRIACSVHGYVCNQGNMLLNYPPCDDSPEVSSLISGVITAGSRRGHYKLVLINVFSYAYRCFRVLSV